MSAMFLYLHNPVPSLQGPVLSRRTVLQDVFDKNAPHHFSVAQTAAHPPASDDADPQRFARLSEKLHSEERTNLSFIRFYFLLLQMIVSKRQRWCC